MESRNWNGYGYRLEERRDSRILTKDVDEVAAMKAIKQRMEKDVDEVGKIARFIQSKIEELEKEVRS
ncbi:hypothetical protein Hanom_Chr10g00904781 [Helianthus anomalus]